MAEPGERGEQGRELRVGNSDRMIDLSQGSALVYGQAHDDLRYGVVLWSLGRVADLARRHARPSRNRREYAAAPAPTVACPAAAGGRGQTSPMWGRGHVAAAWWARSAERCGRRRAPPVGNHFGLGCSVPGPRTVA